MNRFNLTFRGEVLPGYDPERVRASLAEALGIDDPIRLQECFSGDPVILGRNLERKSAAELYAKLHRLGAHSELVRVETREVARNPANQGPPDPAAMRRADLLTGKHLEAEDRQRLKEKEETLQRALRTKQNLQRALRDKQNQQARTDADRALATEAKQKARQAAAEKKAEVAEKKRIKAARAVERKAEKEQKKAEAAAQREAELAERKRLAAQEQARLKVEREEQARLQQAQRAEQQRQAEAAAAARAARREEARQEAEQQATRIKVENAKRKREQAAEATRRKAEELLRRVEAQEREQAEQAEQLAQRKAMEEQAVRRAVEELAQQPSLKPVTARVKTRLELPTKKTRQGAASDPAEAPRKRQPGEPNLYQLTPFRNTPDIRARTEQSQRLMRLAYTAAGLFLACLLVALGILNLPPKPAISGADAILIAPHGRPVLQAGDQLLLHDRAGVGNTVLAPTDLGLASLQQSLAIDPDGSLLATGQLATGEASAGSTEQPALLRCTLTTPGCQLVSEELAGTRVSGLAVHPLDGSVFVADHGAGELLKLSAEGRLLGRAQAPVPDDPTLRLDSGLLLMNSPRGPVINVFRYEDSAFGQQLDEISLQPPGDATTEYAYVEDFVRSGEQWWAALADSNHNTALYRLDGNWQFVEPVELAAGTGLVQLASWGHRVLAGDSSHIPIQRFNQQGVAEAPLVSGLLENLVAGQQRRTQLTALGWRIGLALAALGMLASYGAGSLYRVRSMVYQSCREQGAEPVDKLLDDIAWLPLATNRTARLANTSKVYAALAAAILMSAIGLGVSVITLAALLLALLGPAIALLILQRSEPGHIGITRGKLLLVDHNGTYHLGRDSRIQFRGPFLMIDDVTVFTGTRLLPAFDPQRIRAEVLPIASGGIKVDRKIVSVKLLQSRHPLAVGALAILACSAAALALLPLQGIS